MGAPRRKNENTTPPPEDAGIKDEKPDTPPGDEEAKSDVMPPESWGEALSVPDWKVAGTMAAMGWANDKVVKEAEFKEAIDAFDKRGQGTGRIDPEKIAGKRGD